MRPGSGRHPAALVAVFAALALRPSTALPADWPAGPAIAASAAAALAAGKLVQGPRPRLAGARALTGHERRGRGYVAFTFDDGPLAATTPRILATLAKHEVPAAFFVCGYQLDGDSATRRRNGRALDAVIAAGHLVGNHTYRHTHLAGASLTAALGALAHNERLVAPRLGRTTRLFRPPYGRLSVLAEKLLLDLGYTIVRWSVDADDYRPRSAAQVRDRVLRDVIAQEGGIVLLHDTKTWTTQALPGILDGLERENCRRLARGREPILPVSLDYFAALPVPHEVEAQTLRTRAALEKRCARLRPRPRPD